MKSTIFHKSIIFGLMLIVNALLIGQESLQIILEDRPNERVTLFPTAETSIIEICNLNIGNTYNFVIIHPDNNSFIYELDNEELIQSISNKEVVSDCILFGLNSQFSEVPGSLAPILSVSCIDCPVDDNSTLNQNVPLFPLPSNDPSGLVADIFIGGDCFDTSNANFTGGALSVGTFSGGMSTFGFDEGIMLSSGNVSGATGPSSNFASSNSGGPSGDSDLEQLSGTSSRDVIILEFDFVPTVDQVSFEYVFASEEYCDYSGGGNTINDMFGFFLSGPGINGPFSNSAENIALIPGTNQNVSISTVNQITNSTLFNGNGTDCPGGDASPLDFGFDGYTDVFSAVANVFPCETYHIKLALADGVDNIFDSAVFLKANSFDAGGTGIASSEVPSTGSSDGYETDLCNDAFFTFTRESGSIFEPVIIEYTIGGSAINGVDYTGLPPSPIVIPPGQSTLQIPITIVNDNIQEGPEDLTLFLFGSCSCSTAEVSLTIHDAPELLVSLDDQEICEGIPAVLTANPSGGIQPYSYDWGYGPSPNPTFLDAPTSNSSYTVTITDVCGATTVETVDVTVQALEANLQGDASLCNGGDDASSLEINFSGPQGPYDIAYSLDGDYFQINGINENPYQLPVDEVGTYVLENVTTANCFGAATGSSVVVGSTTSISSNVQNANCADSNNGAISLEISNAEGNITFNWSNGSSLEDQANLAPGNYSVVVTDGAGCEFNEDFTVQANPPILSSIAYVTSVDCDNPTGGSIDINSSGGVGTLSYVWSNGQTTQDLSDLTSGTYSVIITDENNCTNEINDIVIGGSTDIPVLQVESIGSINCIDSNMTLDGETNDNTNIVYSWTDSNGDEIVSGPNADDLLVSTAGVYTLTATNTLNNCFSSFPVNVIPDLEQPIADAGDNVTLNCYNPTIQLNATSSESGDNITYSWVGPNDAIIEDADTNLPLIDTEGTYTLTVTNTDNGCINTSEVEVVLNNNTPSVIIADSAPFTCTTDELVLNAYGSDEGNDFDIEWLSDNNAVILNSNTLEPTISEPGEYTLTITNEINGCIDSYSISVEEDIVEINLDILSDGIVNCYSDEITLNATNSDFEAGYSAEWNLINGSGSVESPNELITQVTGSGLYELTISDGNTGCENSLEFEVLDDLTPPNIEIDEIDLLDCTNTTVTVYAQDSDSGPNFDIIWTGSNPIIDDTSLTPTINTPGQYEVIITNLTNGCQASQIIEVEGDPETSIANISPHNNIDCNNPIVNLNASNSSVGANFTYHWFLDGEEIQGATSFFLNNISNPGMYELLVYNSNNECEDYDSVEIIADNLAPHVEIAETQELNCINEQLVLDGNNSDQGLNYTYNWTSTNPEGIIEGEASLASTIGQEGTYSLEVTNNTNGCSEIASIEVSSNYQQPDLSISPINSLDCSNDQITISNTIVSSYSNQLQYEWSGPSIVGDNFVQEPNVNEPGLYLVIVTDQNNGCSIILDNIYVVENVTPPTAIISNVEHLNCDITTNTLMASTSVGQGNLSYHWVGLNGGLIETDPYQNEITISQAGIYELTVTDSENGCSHTVPTEITIDNTPPTAIAGEDDELLCGETSLTLNASTNLTSNVSYLWSSVDGGTIEGENDIPNPLISSSGTYILTITNEVNGCSEIDEVVISEDSNAPELEVQFSNQSLLNCNTQQLDLQGDIQNVGTNYEYEWSIVNNGNILSGQNTLNPTINEPGTYLLTATNLDNNCDASYSIDVPQNLTTPVVSLSLNNELNCIIDEVTIISDGIDNSVHSYQWTSNNGTSILPNTEEPTVGLPGIYTLTVTDMISECPVTTDIEVTENLVLPDVYANQDIQTINCLDTQASLDGTGSSVGSQFSYQWVNTITNQPVSTELVSYTSQQGSYQLIVTNQNNGCTNDVIVTVEENIDLPQVEAGDSFVLDCNVTQDQLSGSGDQGVIYQYSWNIINGSGIISDPNIANPTVDGPGVFELTITNTENNCSDSDIVEITQNITQPTATISTPSMLTCIEDEIELSINGANISNFLWTSTTGSIIDNPTSENITVYEAGSYEVSFVSTENGCSGVAETTVQQNIDQPQISTEPDNVLNCFTNSVTLTASSDVQSSSFDWLSPSGISLTGSSIVATETGQYQLIVTNLENDCISQTNANVVHEGPTDIITQVRNASCLNPFGSIIVDEVIGGAGSNLYNINEESSYNSNNFFTQLQAGLHIVTVQDLNGCEYEEEFTINEPDEILLDLESEVKLELGQSHSYSPQISIDYDQIATIKWTPATYLDCTDCLQPTTTPLESTTYTITVVDSLGCEAKISTRVDVNNKTRIFIPTAFSPNADSNNNTFFVQADPNQIEIIEAFEIYNRWGEQVFSLYNIPPNDSNYGWDGTYRDQLLNNGVYVYTVTVLMKNGRKEILHGDVSILK